MADTYSIIYIHIIFSVKYRECLLQKPWREEVFKYISGIIEGKGQKTIIVNGVTDHIHILVGLKPSMTLADLVRDIKNNSSKFINDKKWIPGKFQWQEGYEAFSVSQCLLDKTYQYILNQETHHGKVSFQSEYNDWIKENGFTPNPKYLVDWDEEADQ